MAWLPDRLPTKIEPVWSVNTISRGLGGIAATRDLIIYSDRILEDNLDEWKCLSTVDGKEIWSYPYPAKGNLDYGNSPRATPVISGDFVYLQGAFGQLTCLKLKTGELVWDLSLHDEFPPKEEPKWGYCSTPLLIDGKLIVNPGSEKASLVAVDAGTGKIVWKCPGSAAGYGSLIAGKFGGKLQIVGHDSVTLGGWDAKDGKRLWTLRPDSGNDFNVPTPIDLGGELLVTTENNGTRQYRFDDDGRIIPKPVAVNKKLRPDTHTPVVVGNRVFGVWRKLYALDLKNKLEPLWEAGGEPFTRYVSLVASENRGLIVTLESDLILFDTTGEEYRELGKLKVFPDDRGLYAHPALVGKRIYLRGSRSVICLELE